MYLSISMDLNQGIYTPPPTLKRFALLQCTDLRIGLAIQFR